MTEQFKGITILRLKQVMDRTGLSKSTIYSKGNPKLQGRGYDPTFPQQFELGPRAVGWKVFEIDSWLASRVPASGAQVERVHQADKLNERKIVEISRISKKDLIETERGEKRRMPTTSTSPRQDAELPRSHVGKLNEDQTSGMPRILKKDLIETEDTERTRIATVRQILETQAKTGAAVSYEEVMAPIMLSPDIPADRKVIDKILADISKTTHVENKVLLGVLVHERTAGKRRPSDELFNLAESLGYKYDNPDNFVEKQIRQLFDVYEKPTSSSKSKVIQVEMRAKDKITKKMYRKTILVRQAAIKSS